MKKQTLYKIAALLFPALFFGIMVPAFAQDASATVGLTAPVASVTAGTSTSTTSTTKAAKQSAAMAKITARSQAAVTARVNDLNDVLARINAMVHVDATVKANIAATIQTTITNLNTLAAKVASDTTAAQMKTDEQSLITTTRVYMLVVPQARILAAADRAQTVAQMETALDTKLQTLISNAQAAGKDTTAIATAQADVTAKISDANTQASDAINAVSGLVPDNGVASVAASNTAALKAARANLVTADSDLKAGEADLKSIIAALKSFNMNNNSTSTTATTNTTASTSTSTTTTGTAQ